MCSGPIIPPKDLCKAFSESHNEKKKNSQNHAFINKSAHVKNINKYQKGATVNCLFLSLPSGNGYKSD